MLIVRASISAPSPVTARKTCSEARALLPDASTLGFDRLGTAASRELTDYRGVVTCGGDTDAWISWKLAAKYFFDPNFGGAASPFRRNVLASTLDLTGVAFLNGPRNNTPLISRFKVRTSEHSDLEWDADYDFKSKRLDASNIFADYRRESVFGSVGYSTLQTLNGNFTANLASQVTKYNLLRLLLGYGAPTKRGLSIAANAGYDFTQDALQYGGVETSYNLDCCGLVIEYRRLALGSVRNENLYSFSFTLAGVGAAGNLTHSERIF